MAGSETVMLTHYGRLDAVVRLAARVDARSTAVSAVPGGTTGSLERRALEPGGIAEPSEPWTPHSVRIDFST